MYSCISNTANISKGENGFKHLFLNLFLIPKEECLDANSSSQVLFYKVLFFLSVALAM